MCVHVHTYSTYARVTVKLAAAQYALSVQRRLSAKDHLKVQCVLVGDFEKKQIHEVHV